VPGDDRARWASQPGGPCLPQTRGLASRRAKLTAGGHRARALGRLARHRWRTAGRLPRQCLAGRSHSRQQGAVDGFGFKDWGRTDAAAAGPGCRQVAPGRSLDPAAKGWLASLPNQRLPALRPPGRSPRRPCRWSPGSHLQAQIGVAFVGHGQALAASTSSHVTPQPRSATPWPGRGPSPVPANQARAGRC